MDTVYKYSKTTTNTKVNTIKVFFMVKVNIFGQMVVYFMVILLKVSE